MILSSSCSDGNIGWEKRIKAVVMIGVFWIHRGAVFGKAVPLDEGVEGVPSIIDCEVNHVDVWEFDKPWLAIDPLFSQREYQDVPRGRVLFLARQKRPLVYADKTLLNAVGKNRIASFFGFDVGAAVWKSDAHYSTSGDEIGRFFDDNV